MNYISVGSLITACADEVKQKLGCDSTDQIWFRPCYYDHHVECIHDEVNPGHAPRRIPSWPFNPNTPSKSDSRRPLHRHLSLHRIGPWGSKSIRWRFRGEYQFRAFSINTFLRGKLRIRLISLPPILGSYKLLKKQTSPKWTKEGIAGSTWYKVIDQLRKPP